MVEVQPLPRSVCTTAAGSWRAAAGAEAADIIMSLALHMVEVMVVLLLLD